MESVEALRMQLQDPDEETRHLAVQSLAGLGAAALQPLGEALGDRSWRVRKAALEAFVAVPGAQKMEILLRGIRDEESAGRRNTSMEALIRLGEDSLPHIPSLLVDGDPDVRKFGVDILGNIDAAGALKSLLGALEDEEDNVAAAAAEYLGKKGRREAVPALVERAGRGGFWVKYSCLKALGEIGDPSAGEAVLAAAAEGDLRKVAVEALGRMGLAEAGPFVVEGLFSGDRGLRRIAVLAASRLLRAMEERGDDTAALREEIRKAAGGEFGDFLGGLLRHDDDELRDGAMRLLGIAAGRGAIEPLLEVLADVTEDEQELIAGVLAELPEEDLPALFPRLRDDQPSTRQWVARVLGRRRCRGAVPHLVGLLEDDTGHVRSEAARALGRTGDGLAVAPLVSLLNDPYPDVREAGVDALVALGGGGEEMRQLVLSFLGPQMDSRDQDLSANALRIASRLGGSDVLERLKFSLKDERSQIRRTAVEALGSIEGPEAVEVLRLALTDEDTAVRREAVQRLGGKREVDVTSILRPMLLDEDMWVRVRAVQAVAAGGGEEARRLLLEAVRTEPPGPVKLAAIRALGQAGGGEARGLLIDLSAVGDREIRMAAIEALGRIGGREAVERLISFLQDEEWGLRSAAVRALASFAGDPLVRSALEGVARGDGDAMVRRTAADLLGLPPS